MLLEVSFAVVHTKLSRSVKISDLFLKLSRNNWHGAFLPNIKLESRENENNIFSS